MRRTRSAVKRVELFCATSAINKPPTCCLAVAAPKQQEPKLFLKKKQDNMLLALLLTFGSRTEIKRNKLNNNKLNDKLPPPSYAIFEPTGTTNCTCCFRTRISLTCDESSLANERGATDGSLTFAASPVVRSISRRFV